MIGFRRWVRRAGFGLSAALLLAGGVGCKTYHYYDMDVTYGSSFNVVASGNVQLALANVSDDSQNLDIPMSVLAGNKFPDLGAFEYSTFTDSGTITFTVRAYNGSNATDACLYGEGTKAMAASGEVTQTGTITVERTSGAGCPNDQPDAGLQ
jgi:hypothetical protein